MKNLLSIIKLASWITFIALVFTNSDLFEKTRMKIGSLSNFLGELCQCWFCFSVHLTFLGILFYPGVKLQDFPVILIISCISSALILSPDKRW